MSDSGEEVITEKKGRGRPPAEKSDKVWNNMLEPFDYLHNWLCSSSQKRKAEPEKDDSPPTKKGRGRPKGSAAKKVPAKKAEPKAKASRKPKKKSSSEEEESEDSSA